MKLNFKRLVAAAAFAAATAAHAASGFPWQLDSGTGSLTFTQDALAAISASSALLITTATLPSMVGLNVTPGAINTASSAPGVVTLAFSSATLQGDEVTSLQAANSFLDIKRTTIDAHDVLQSNSIFMANFDVNLGNSTIYADLYTRDNTKGILTSLGKQAIFTATEPGGVTGGTQGLVVVDHRNSDSSANGHASGRLYGPLRMTASTAEIVLSGLGLPTADNDPVASLVRRANWGNTTATGYFHAPNLMGNYSPDLPEPASYVLFGLGLTGIGIVSRRRRIAA
jgi:hypothetical protein